MRGGKYLLSILDENREISFLLEPFAVIWLSQLLPQYFLASAKLVKLNIIWI